MSGMPESDFVPNLGQIKTLDRIAAKATKRVIAKGEREFPALSLYQKIRSFGIPGVAIQHAIVEAFEDKDIDVQTFRAYTYQGYDIDPSAALLVRVTQLENEEALPSVKETAMIPGRHGFIAVDVYPPQE